MPSLKELLNGNTESDSLASVPEYIMNAPAEVRQRIRALKKLQVQAVNIQTEFYKKVHELECQYRLQYDVINKQRADIVNGAYEPAENECDVELFHWMTEEDKHKFSEQTPVSGTGPIKGIPNFWLNSLLSVPGLDEMITKEDEDVLKYLTNITVSQTKDPASFTLHFVFDENPYFSNQEITKFYKLSLGPNGFEPTILYDGPSIVASQGCAINWKEGQNLTQKVVKKKQRKGNETRETIKTIEAVSFFNLFTEELQEITEDMEDTAAAMMNEDFEIGQTIRDSVIDAAVLFYTGECVEDEEDLDAFEDEEFSDDEEDEE